jgi:ABC-type sugar transport system substrate-binding protein
VLRKLAVPLCVGALIAASGACSSSGSSNSSASHTGSSAPSASNSPTAPAPKETGAAKAINAKPGSGKGLTLGFVNLDASNPFWADAGQGIRQQIKRSGAKLVSCDSKRSVKGALNCVKQLKSKKVDGYLISQQEKSAGPRICAAGPKNVPVVSFDVRQKPCSHILAGADNIYAGYISGKGLGKYYKQHFNCKYDKFIEFQLSDAGKLNTERIKGFRQGFSSQCGKIHNTQTEESADPDSGRTKMTNILTSLPSSHHIPVVAIDDSSLIGAFAAAKQQNRAGDIYTAGTGMQKEARCVMIKHTKNWVGSAGFFAEDWGKISVPYLIKAIKGKHVPSELKIRHEFITPTNVKKYYPKVHKRC